MNARNDNPVRNYGNGFSNDRDSGHDNDCDNGHDNSLDNGYAHENSRRYVEPHYVEAHYIEPRYVEPRYNDYRGYDERRGYGEPRYYGEPRGYGYAPEPVVYEQPRKSHLGVIAVSIALAAALGGAGAFIAATGFGKVAPSQAAGSQITRIEKVTNTTNTTNTSSTSNTSNTNSGENKSEDAPGYTDEQCRCRDLALSVFNGDGQATNVTVSGITQGGGASTCYVEFDKGGQHYTVRVNADDYKIVYGSSTDGVHETTYDENGNALNTIEA